MYLRDSFLINNTFFFQQITFNSLECESHPYVIISPSGNLNDFDNNRYPIIIIKYLLFSFQNNKFLASLQFFIFKKQFFFILNKAINLFI